MVKVVVVGRGRKSFSDVLSAIFNQYVEEPARIDADLYSSIKSVGPEKSVVLRKGYDKMSRYRKIGKSRDGFSKTFVRWHRI